MKKVILTIALAAMTLAASAQNFGVKLGGNLNSVADMDDYNVGSTVGCYIGGVVELGLPVANLGLRIEPAYSMQGFKFDDVTVASITTKQSVASDYINVPVLAEYKLLGGDLALMAGPQVGICLGASTKTTIGDNEPDTYKYESDEYNTIDFGIVFGATYMVTRNVGIDLRYNLGISKLYPEVSVAGLTTEAFGQNRILSIGACYMF